MRRFEYFAPSDISDVLQLLSTLGENTKLLAGGTDLIGQMKSGEISLSYLIDLKRIKELIGIYCSSNGTITLSPGTTISEIESSKYVATSIPILCEAARAIGSVQIRNRATVGGNVCRAAPSADLVPPLIVLDAEVKIRSLNSERILPLEDFFIGPGTTVLKYNEILTEIRMQTPPSSSAGVYLKHGLRESMDLAVVGTALFLVLHPRSSICKDIRISLGSVAPTPIRAKKAEQILLGEKITLPAIEETAIAASEEACPISDVYGPDWYKKEIIRVLVKRAVVEAKKKIADQKNEA